MKSHPTKTKFDKFLTWDIETRTIDNKMVPYCICVFDGRNKFSFYLSDHKTVGAMLLAAIKLIFTKKGDFYKYDGYIVYAHNFSKFDSIFLLKFLSMYSDNHKYTLDMIRSPRWRESDFIEISISKPRTFKIKFRDSLLLIQGSLKSLAKGFGVDQKGTFPYLFVNDINTPFP